MAGPTGKVRERPLLAVVLVVAAACTHSAGSGNGESTKSCAALTAGDIQHVARIQTSTQETLAKTPGSDVRCSTLFIDQSGHLILQLTETGGGRAALRTLRKGTVSLVGRAAVRELPALGLDAFVARRVLGFVRDGQLVTLQTGYSASGRLELTDDQLVQLAEIFKAADSGS